MPEDESISDFPPIKVPLSCWPPPEIGRLLSARLSAGEPGFSEPSPGGPPQRIDTRTGKLPSVDPRWSTLTCMSEHQAFQLPAVLLDEQPISDIDPCEQVGGALVGHADPPTDLVLAIGQC